jgi:prolyl-tRNA editing enzyme YbaK/EbsC (Cys-tRNA(Pro) deacylase)
MRAPTDVLGVEEASIAKSILFMADEQPLMVVLCGNTTVDVQRLLKHLNSPQLHAAGIPEISCVQALWTSRLHAPACML